MLTALIIIGVIALALIFLWKSEYFTLPEFLTSSERGTLAKVFFAVVLLAVIFTLIHGQTNSSN